MKKDPKPSLGIKIMLIILILLGLAFVASVGAGFIMLFGAEYETGNVAVIPVEGVIVAGTGAVPTGVITSDRLIEDLERAAEAGGIEGVVLLVNSPGGSAVASEEIAAKVASFEKPIVAVIREVGASGAYWVASSADQVYANRMSVTGSLGVIGSYLSFGQFLRDWNVTHNRLVAGELKDIGTPFRELTPAEEEFLQDRLDRIHEFFIAAVQENRNLTEAELRPVADGRFLLGAEALAVGLVDDLGGKEEALAWLEKELDIAAEPVTYEHKRSLAEILATVQSRNPLDLAQQASVPMAR